MRLPRIEMIFAFLPLHLIQYNVEGKNFLVETKDDNTRRTPSGLVCEYLVRCVCKIAQGQSKGRGPEKNSLVFDQTLPRTPPSRFGKGPDFLSFFFGPLTFLWNGFALFQFHINVTIVLLSCHLWTSQLVSQHIRVLWFSNRDTVTLSSV